MGTRHLRVGMGLGQIIAVVAMFLLIIPVIMPPDGNVLSPVVTFADNVGKIYYILLGMLLLYGMFRWYGKTKKIQDWNIYCLKCEQYLGTGSNFKSSCPRCGSNRYEKSKN